MENQNKAGSGPENNSDGNEPYTNQSPNHTPQPNNQNIQNTQQTNPIGNNNDSGQPGNNQTPQNDNDTEKQEQTIWDDRGTPEYNRALEEFDHTKHDEIQQLELRTFKDPVHERDGYFS